MNLKSYFLHWCLLSAIFNPGCYAESKKPDAKSIGPNASADFVIYFKQGTTEEQIGYFHAEVLSSPRPDGRGANMKAGIQSILRLLPEQANGREAIAIILHNGISEAQRTSVRRSIDSSPIVDKVLENIAPDKAPRFE